MRLFVKQVRRICQEAAEEEDMEEDTTAEGQETQEPFLGWAGWFEVIA